MPEASSWKAEVERRLRPLGLAAPREAEIVEELAAHLEDEYRRLVGCGASGEEARRIALEGLGSGESLAEWLRQTERPVTREPIILGMAERKTLMADLWQDVRYALRILRRTPGFTALAVFSLALGIGGNAAMFSIVSAALIRPLPYPQPERLVQAASSGYYPPGGLADLQQESKTMEFAGYTPGVQLNLTGQGEAWRLTGSAVSANLFGVLGAGVELGRGFEPGNDQAGRDNLVILGHALWRDKFGGEAGVVGRVITLGGVDRQVVGVMPTGFAFPDAASAFWIPLHLDPRDPTTYWEQGFMPVVARLRPGATLAEAQGEIRTVSRAMIHLFPYPMGSNFNADATVVPLQQFLVTDFRTKLIVLQCAIGLVLLIACANVASLLLARAASRQKEMALRAALGAARSRIARQLLTESVTLAAAGGAVGVALAYSTFSALKLTLPATFAIGSNVQMGWQVLVFAGVLSIGTGLAFGLAPALSALRQNLVETIKTGGQRSAGTARTRLRSALIAGEVAVAVVLTLGAGLLIKSLWKLAQVNPGFQSGQILTLRVSPNRTLCKEQARCLALYDELLRRTREIPDVEDAAAANALPLTSYIPSFAVQLEGVPYDPAQHTAPMFWGGAVTPGYFDLMRVPIVAGRSFSASDNERSEPVVIVSAATARKYWPGQNPVGKHLRAVWQNRWSTVVGVAGDVRQFDLQNHTPDYIEGELYMPYPQSVDDTRRLPDAMTLIVRTGATPTSVAGGILELVRNLNPDVPVSEIQTMVSLVNNAAEQPRSMMWLFAVFAGAALGLAAIGTYGVISYSTAQRTYEIGVRVALGASRSSIFGLVLGQGLRLVLVGLAVGLAASFALTRMLTAFLYGTAANDPVTFLAVAGLLVAIGILAGYVPARRAAGISPLIALRTE